MHAILQHELGDVHGYESTGARKGYRKMVGGAGLAEGNSRCMGCGDENLQPQGRESAERESTTSAWVLQSSSPM